MDNKTQDKLQKLFVNYTQKLPDKIHHLRTNWKELLNHYDPKKFEDFHREAHTLCGSAATYGYMSLSKAARELELGLKALLGNPHVTKDKQELITSLINKIESNVWTAEESTFLSQSPHLEQDRLVYVLETDKSFTAELNVEAVEAGYKLEVVNNFQDLLSKINHATPAAMVIETSFLDEEATVKLTEFQEQRDIVIPLFCISASGNISERLRAIRAASSGFIRKPADAYYLIKTIDQAVGETNTDHFRILIVDDSPSLSEYYSYILQEAGMVTKSITDSMQTLDAIVEFQPDLILMDVYMPNCTGIELAAVLRQEPKYTHIPIIFLSSEEDKYKQLSAGGDDFLTKPILPQHLITAVKSRAKRAGILSSYMMRDSLTGLLNHSNILHQLDLVLTRAQRHKQSVTFAMIDLDKFKEVNDKYGHMIGDRVLKKLSELLMTRLRKSDYIGRYGGEEFAVILTNTKVDTSRKILEDLREKFSQIPFFANDHEFTVSFSVGIAGFPEITDTHELIEMADKALYQAKRNGRNQIFMF